MLIGIGLLIYVDAFFWARLRGMRSKDVGGRTVKVKVKV